MWNTKPPPPSPPELYIFKQTRVKLIFLNSAQSPLPFPPNTQNYAHCKRSTIHARTDSHVNTPVCFPLSHRLPDMTLTHPPSSRHRSTHPSTRQGCCPPEGLGDPGGLPQPAQRQDPEPDSSHHSSPGPCTPAVGLDSNSMGLVSFAPEHMICESKTKQKPNQNDGIFCGAWAHTAAHRSQVAPRMFC